MGAFAPWLECMLLLLVRVGSAFEESSSRGHDLGDQAASKRLNRGEAGQASLCREQELVLTGRWQRRKQIPDTLDSVTQVEAVLNSPGALAFAS